LGVRITEEEAGAVRFSMAEVFDCSAALAIGRWLKSAGREAGATIDFRGVRHCEPLAVALLAQVVRGRPGRIHLLGMCLPERKLLAYFGVSGDPASGGAPGTAAERQGQRMGSRRSEDG